MDLKLFHSLSVNLLARGVFKPRMMEALLESNTIIIPIFDHLRQKILCVLRNICRLLIIANKYQLFNVVVSESIEGVLSCEHLVDDDTH